MLIYKYNNMENDLTIHTLSTSDMRFAKELKVVTKEPNDRAFGVIAYVRIPSESYRVHQIPMNEFNRYLLGCQEDEYPRDELDDLIFDALKLQFDVISKTSFIMFDSEIRGLGRQIAISKPAIITININIIDANTNIVSHSIQIPIYCMNYRCTNAFDNISIPVSISQERWDNIQTNLGTIQSLGSYLSNLSKSKII